MRDARGIGRPGFPDFSRGLYAQDKGPRRKVIDFRCTTEIGAVRLVHGDLVLADRKGVPVTPQAAEETAVRRALAKVATEAEVAKAIRAGMSACETFRTFGACHAGARRDRPARVGSAPVPIRAGVRTGAPVAGHLDAVQTTNGAEPDTHSGDKAVRFCRHLQAQRGQRAAGFCHLPVASGIAARDVERATPPLDGPDTLRRQGLDAEAWRTREDSNSRPPDS